MTKFRLFTAAFFLMAMFAVSRRYVHYESDEEGGI